MTTRTHCEKYYSGVAIITQEENPNMFGEKRWFLKAGKAVYPDSEDASDGAVMAALVYP